MDGEKGKHMKKKTEKFILKRDGLRHIPDDQKAVVKITGEAYNLLIDMANESGMPLSKVASKAIKYASENVCYERSEE